jgi:TPR repeat protein
MESSSTDHTDESLIVLQEDNNGGTSNWRMEAWLATVLTEWFVHCAFLNSKVAFVHLHSWATERKSLLAQAFVLRFKTRRNEYGIPVDLLAAREDVARLTCRLLNCANTVHFSNDDEAIYCACCQYVLGFCYAEGLFGKPNIEEAQGWFKRSAGFGYPPALSNLGVCIASKGDVDSKLLAAELYRLASCAGFAPAQCNLGMAFLYGVGVETNGPQGLSWLQKSVDQGFGAAEVNLGFLYDSGRHVAVNKEEALRLYHRAAEKGNPIAQYNLGLCYEFGDGVDKDLNQARGWYLQAHEAGDRKSAIRLREVEYEQEADDCPICLEKANLRGRRMLLSPGCCGKLFHETCFRRALSSSLGHYRCPACRQLI